MTISLITRPPVFKAKFGSNSSQPSTSARGKNINTVDRHTVIETIPGDGMYIAEGKPFRTLVQRGSFNYYVKTWHRPVPIHERSKDGEFYFGLDVLPDGTIVNVVRLNGNPDVYPAGNGK